MKFNTALMAVAVLGLAACDTMNRPISEGAFDPLRPPGSGLSNISTAGPGFTAGQFVRGIMDNTAFFKARPKGDADADKLLPRGTSMKVISADDSYVRVELDSGEVGWVPAVMVEDPSAATTAPTAPFEATNPGEYQIYPPVGGADGSAPPVNTSEQPPGGSIPTVIDPEAPVTPVPDLPAETTPAPLPPNGQPE